MQKLETQYDTTLNGKRIAILATHGVEESELVEPRKALDNAGVKTELLTCIRKNPGHAR